MKEIEADPSADEEEEKSEAKPKDVSEDGRLRVRSTATMEQNSHPRLIVSLNK